MYQGQIYYAPVKLTLSGTPVTGVLYSALTLKYWQAGQISFTTTAVLIANWTELGDGWYVLTLPATLTNTIGAFYFSLSGTGFDTYENSTLTVEAPPVSTALTPTTCAVTGNVVDLGGLPGQGQRITFRIVSVPYKTVAGSLIAADRVNTTPDAYGNFSVALIYGATVIVEIESAGINHQIVIPSQSSATLLSLLPPIP